MDATALNLTTLALLGLLAITLPLTGVLLAITPFLMPKRECFAVTIPGSAASDPYIKQLKRTYCLAVLVATTMLTLATIASMAFGSERVFLPVFVISVLVLFLGGYALMLHFRAKTQSYKRKQNWEASSDKRGGFIAEEIAPKPLSLKWDLLFIPAVVIAIGMAVVGYSLMPERIPMQINLAGETSSWVSKSPAVAAFPAVLSAFLALCLTFSHWSILRSKKGIDAARPAASAWAYGSFARAQSKLIVGLGTMFSFIGPLMCLTFCGIVSLQQMLLPIVIMVAVTLAATFGVGVAYGQNGSRLLQKVDAPESMPTDDDRHWKLGVFYWNGEDASLFVPNRFGIGWGMNLGRPAAWAIIATFVLIVAALVIFSVTL